MFDHPSEFVRFKTSPHLPGVELYSARLIEHAFALHVHDAYSIGAIEAGVERFRYRGSDYLAPADAVVMLNPGELHTGQAEVAAGWTYQMLYIEPATLRELTGSEAFFPDAVVYDPALAAAYRNLFVRMWHAPDDLAFVSEFTRLIDAIVLRYGRNARAIVTPSGAVLSPASLRRTLDFIEANLHDTLHIDQIAAQAGLSMFHFARAFSSTLRVTPHQYVQARRTVRAKSMLLQRAPPSDAAAAVGLTDQSHLNRWFKRAYGVTPAEYQQQTGTRPDPQRRR